VASRKFGVKVLTTFGRVAEFQQARGVLDGLGLAYEVLSPPPACVRVGVPCLVMDADIRRALAARAPQEFICAGWVDYRNRSAELGTRNSELKHRKESASGAVSSALRAPSSALSATPAHEDVLGEVAIMVLAPCVLDEARIRLIAHIGGDLGPLLPYLNAEMPHAIYNPRAAALTYMEGYRMMTLYGRRITIAKADEIVDAWRILESIRLRAADVWARRADIRPSHVCREKPSVIEIFKRLPRTNCRACGEQTCLAFAARVHAGEAAVTRCLPVFEGEFGHFRDALLAVAAVSGAPDGL
jgi:ArsR family metal-binding transcriptional regulator